MNIVLHGDHYTLWCQVWVEGEGRPGEALAKLLLDVLAIDRLAEVGVAFVHAPARQLLKLDLERVVTFHPRRHGNKVDLERLGFRRLPHLIDWAAGSS